MLLQLAAVVLGSILGAPIGMMDAALRRLPARNRRFECRQREPSIDPPANSVTDHTARPGPAHLLSSGRVTFLTRGVDGAACAPAAFAAFNACLSPQPARDDAWTASTWNRRNALIALDGHAAGASYREIATVIFGARDTAQSWRTTGKSLKFQVSRARDRGEALIAGSYRNLLK